MVAIAIIAIISLLGVPTYKTYQAKARQKEGFNLMNGFYVAAIATHTEFRVFPGNLVQTGFAPTGLIGYRIHTQDGTDILGPNDDVCQTTAGACDCGGACPNYKTWVERGPGVIGAAIGVHQISGGFCDCGGLGRFTADDTFRIKISGVINTNALAIDCWAIDHLKAITLCSDGLK